MVITRFADDKTRKAADENVSLVAAEQKRARQTFTLTEEHVSRLAEWFDGYWTAFSVKRNIEVFLRADES